MHAPTVAKNFEPGQAKALSATRAKGFDMLSPPPKRAAGNRSDSATMPDESAPFSAIGERMLWHRELHGMNQAEMAAALGVKRPIYSMWESGRARLSQDGALRIRALYGISLDFLLVGDLEAVNRLPLELRNHWLQWKAKRDRA